MEICGAGEELTFWAWLSNWTFHEMMLSVVKAPMRSSHRSYQGALTGEVPLQLSSIEVAYSAGEAHCCRTAQGLVTLENSGALQPHNYWVDNLTLLACWHIKITLACSEVDQRLLRRGFPNNITDTWGKFRIQTDNSLFIAYKISNTRS